MISTQWDWQAWAGTRTTLPAPAIRPLLPEDVQHCAHLTCPALASLLASGQRFSFPPLSWQQANTDAMALLPSGIDWAPGDGGPHLGDRALSIDEYAGEVMAGFDMMYRLLVDLRATLLESDGPLARFRGQVVRYLHRPTRVYGLVLQRSNEATYLRDGADRGIHLEHLARVFDSACEPPLQWPVVAAEEAALEDGDIPFFSASTVSADLTLPGRCRIERCFETTGYERVLLRVRSLGEEDLARQKQVLRAALFCHEARAVEPVTAGAAHQPAAIPLSGPELLAEATGVGERILASAIRGSDGSLAWIAPQFLPAAERFQLQPLSHGLYNGQCGVGLFLAALAITTGDATWREAALGAVWQLRDELAQQGSRVAARLGFGVAGLGGVLYGLSAMGRLLDDARLIDDALRLTAAFTAERLAADTAHDVVLGSAGDMLALLALQRHTGERRALDAAELYGRQLLRVRTAGAGGLRGWATLRGKLLTGMSHGAAGIAYALLRLFEAGGDDDFRQAAQEAMALENALFDTAASNWPDLRGDSGVSFPAQWCHGAAGIGLARVGGLRTWDTPEIRSDIEAALHATEVAGLSPFDQMCCGNAGRAELFIVAGETLGRPELLDRARALLSSVIARASEAGEYALHPQLPHGVGDPTLFQGPAGIGYELLRLAKPDALPSVLLMA